MAAAKQDAAEPAAKEYEDIPGTFVFDADRSREGYHLNMFCMSLMKAENRKAFKDNEAEYLERFPMTEGQREAILKRDYNRMLELGGNIYFTAKLGATDGHSFQHMAAVMTGSTQEDYAKMMLGGGRAVDGNRSKTGIEPGARSAGGKRASAKPKAGTKPKTPRAPKMSVKGRAPGTKTGSTVRSKSALTTSKASSRRGRKAGAKRG